MISTEFLQEKQDKKVHVIFAMSNGKYYEGKIKNIDTESVLIHQDECPVWLFAIWERDVLIQRAYIVSVMDVDEKSYS